MIFKNVRFISSILECYSQKVDKKYWKMSRVVEVITSENIEFITSGQTITTMRDPV